MSARIRIFVVTFSAVVALYAIAGGYLSNRNATAKGNQWAQLRIFDEVLFHIVKDYVDEPDMERVRIGAMRGLAEGLDAYSAYLTPAQVADFKPVEPGLQDVAGMALSKVGGYVYVVAVLKGSAADRAGIVAGDFIEYLGKAPTRDMSLYDAEMLLLSARQGPTDLKLFRKGEVVKVTFTPGGPASSPAMEAKILETGIGYLHIPSLGEGRTVEARAAIEQLVAKGARRLVLDLRGSALGQLGEGADLADLFIDEGQLARQIGHNGVEVSTFGAKKEDTIFKGPLTVLIDRSTAGAAEAVASAILIGKRGEVVGEKSFGAGVELSLFKLRDGGALLITTARYAPATGKPFTEEPVTPSVTVERPDTGAVIAPDESEEDDPSTNPEPDVKSVPKPAPPAEDVQLKKAVEVLKGLEVPAARAA